MSLPGLIITGAALAVCVVNVACFGNQPAWRGAALAFAGTLGTAAAAADHIWWFMPIWLLLTAWGLLGLANARKPPNDHRPERGNPNPERTEKEGKP